MKVRALTLILLICCLGCGSGGDSSAEMVFDQEKWLTQEGSDYPYREKMLHDVVYNDTIRSLDKSEILDLLGKPDRIKDNHHYYEISRNRLGPMTMNAKSMVIKYTDGNSVEWIKIHE